MANSTRSALAGLWDLLHRATCDGGRLAVLYRPAAPSLKPGIHHDISMDIRQAGFDHGTEIRWRAVSPKVPIHSLVNGGPLSAKDPTASTGQIQVFNRGSWRLPPHDNTSQLKSKDFIRSSDGLWKIRPRSRVEAGPTGIPGEIVKLFVLIYTYRGNHVLLSQGFGASVRRLVHSCGRPVRVLTE